MKQKRTVITIVKRLSNEFVKLPLEKVFLFLMFMGISIMGYAHRINAYKFIYINETGNLYGVEEALKNYFTNIGFKTITSYEIEEMSSEDKGQLLIAKYEWDIVYGGHSTLLLTLSDLSGTTIFKTSGRGKGRNATMDMKRALMQIYPTIDALNYTYTPDMLKIQGKGYTDFALWSEDSIKNYLRLKSSKSVEGIYKNYSNNLDYYRIAILKDKDTYYGIILDTDNSRWNKGDTKIVLRHIEKETYDVEYYEFKGKRINAVGTYKNRILSCIANSFGTFQFLKIFPSGNLGESDILQNASENDLKATGSGFIISGNIVATNYHVIEDAENIKIVLNTEEGPEEYKAKVLSVDKTNDLALLTIKDEKFSPLKPAPYSIAYNIVDVGTSVFTMGYPLSKVLGKEVKITDGVISSKTGYEGDAVTYQISAPIQPGNSGGPLFDKRGHLIGITNAGISSAAAENVGYAIKTPYLHNLIDSAPIDIVRTDGIDLTKTELPEMIKLYTPYIALIKVY